MLYHGNFMYSVYPKAGKVYLTTPYKGGFRKTVVSLEQLPRIIDNVFSIYPYESNSGAIRYRFYSKKTKRTMVLARWLTNCPEDLEVDHFPLHNPSINTNDNLRCVPAWVNQRNRRNNVSSSDHFGVYLKNNHWCVFAKDENKKFKQVMKFPLNALEQAKDKQRKAQLGFNYDGLYSQIMDSFGAELPLEAREYFERIVKQAGVHKGA
ncbi:hypothetical protein ACFPYJ_01590 [Paenibacillus solisilvae]|uniref:HNH nuclease domain-containing protein n=2 Tax=Paenibacillus solisilvae TaxID=2486751 RepID=A0ABW0VPZ6_9BACL